jgi:hypothetical protein
MSCVKIPKVVNVSKNSLDKRGIASFAEWIATGENLYVARRMRFVQGTFRSPYANPYPKDNGNEWCMQSFETWIRTGRDEKTGRTNTLLKTLKDDMAGKSEIGCWCVEEDARGDEEICHGQILVKILKEQLADDKDEEEVEEVDFTLLDKVKTKKPTKPRNVVSPNSYEETEGGDVIQVEQPKKKKQKKQPVVTKVNPKKRKVVSPNSDEETEGGDVTQVEQPKKMRQTKEPVAQEEEVEKSNHSGVITWRGRVENHKGMQMIGTAKDPLDRRRILHIKHEFEKKGVSCRLIKLHKKSMHNDAPKAYVLVVKNGGTALADMAILQTEVESQTPDKTFLHYGKVDNKLLRWNFCIADDKQAPDVANGKGTVVDFDTMPEVKKLRQGLATLDADFDSLNGEVNLYYKAGCGISRNGDGESGVVIGSNFGKSRYIEWSLYNRSKVHGVPFKLQLDHGDLYFMGEKAIGGDWRSPSKWTYRHRAGDDVFFAKNDKQIAAKVRLKEKNQKAKSEAASKAPAACVEEEAVLTKKVKKGKKTNRAKRTEVLSDGE